MIVEGFVRQKSRVFFLDVAESESQALVERLGDGAKFVKCDVTDIDGAAAPRSPTIEAKAGPVAVLVNNAANDDRHKLEDVTPEYWEERIAVNLRHLFFAAQAVAPGMKKRRRRLDHQSRLGVLASRPLPDLALYETAKAGIEGLTRALARDLGEANIRVNCVVPGAIRTPRQMKLWHTPEEEAKILAQQCLKAARRPGARHRDGAVPRLRRRAPCAPRTTTGSTPATAETSDERRRVRLAGRRGAR